MADKMTLQQARDHVFIVINSSHLPGWEKNREAWKVLDAHIAAMGEPVAWAAGLEPTLKGWIDTKAWTEGEFTIPLYRAPPASGDMASLQSRLAAADALLRFMRTRFDAHMDDSDRASIDAHLQGAGDERA